MSFKIYNQLLLLPESGYRDRSRLSSSDVFIDEECKYFSSLGSAGAILILTDNEALV